MFASTVKYAVLTVCTKCRSADAHVQPLGWYGHKGLWHSHAFTLCAKKIASMRMSATHAFTLTKPRKDSNASGWSPLA
jgi:hypothetical protein